MTQSVGEAGYRGKLYWGGVLLGLVNGDVDMGDDTDEVDTTCRDTAPEKTSLPGLRSRQISFNALYDPDNTVLAAMEEDYEAQDTAVCTITNEAGKGKQATCWVKTFSVKQPFTGSNNCSIVLKPATVWTKVTGYTGS
jgi:hypothetical protein